MDAKMWYITHPDATYKSTAEKYGLSENVLMRTDAREQWREERRKWVEKRQKKTLEKTADRAAEKAAAENDADIDEAYAILRLELRNARAIAEEADGDSQRHRQNTQTTMDILQALIARQAEQTGQREQTEVVLRGDLAKWGS